MGHFHVDVLSVRFLILVIQTCKYNLFTDYVRVVHLYTGICLITHTLSLIREIVRYEECKVDSINQQARIPIY